ncbi:MAG: RNA 2',3'-cyclic phosphodiesterase [Planctomycetota bacterium]|nr:RNA 2',3'-cyclic phosphodiesterase [Planctomycetota bacterium]
MSTKRLFIAVEMDESVRKRIAEMTAPLKKANADVKWVQQDNLHITLKFLGEVDEGRIGVIVDAARGALAGFKPFVLTLGELGTFPPRGKPRVIWLAIRDVGGVLAGMSGALEKALEKEGFPAEDREFTAHLTLGRVRSPKGVERLEAAMAGLSAGAGGEFAQKVDKVFLVRSVLTSAGPVYSTEHAFQLVE